MKSKFYGAAVVNVWGDTIRYGIVRDSKECGGWTYLNCDWIDDHAYEHDKERVCNLRGVERDAALEWLRVDKVKFINIKEEITKLSKLSYAVSEVDGSSDYNYYLTESSNRFAVLT
tara:strand:+ start:1018 stop:1365 length:348 start_codon:yes stop_codon:yes gene_type:complete